MIACRCNIATAVVREEIKAQPDIPVSRCYFARELAHVQPRWENRRLTPHNNSDIYRQKIHDLIRLTGEFVVSSLLRSLVLCQPVSQAAETLHLCRERISTATHYPIAQTYYSAADPSTSSR